MAVYTKLKEKDINNILSDYSIGKLKSFKGIQEGIENASSIDKTNIGIGNGSDL